jgi:flagellar assembly protein FliH
MMISPFEAPLASEAMLQTSPHLGVVVGADLARLEFAVLDTVRPKLNVDEENEPSIDSPHIHPNDHAAQTQYLLQTQQHVEDEIEVAYQRGSVDGREREAADCRIAVAAERDLVFKVCAGFKTERESYFASVEAEVVKLALAIAARVLHRESRLDPMLLRGVVKVALEQVADESGTTLRVPLDYVSAWQSVAEEYGVMTLEVAGDATMLNGECVLETKVGRVELGIAAQMEEIEKGFFDILQQRPA